MVAERRRGPILMEVPRDRWEEAQVEANVLREEARQVAGIIPSALAVHRYVQMVGESVERIARRHL